MQYKDIVPLITSVLTFILGGALVYWRENKKSFQEKIFEYKYTAYREIIEQIGIYYQDVYSLLDIFQCFEGTEEEWQKTVSEECIEYYEKARKLENLYFRHLVILPESQLNRLQSLISLASGHITNHFHYKSDAPHSSYERIWADLIDFAENARKDIKVDILNVSLGKRLSQQFYPISLPSHSIFKKVKSD